MIATLTGKTALITGGAHRIGQTIARALAGAGVNVVLHYAASGEAAAGLRDELARTVKSWTVPADFTHPTEYETLIPRAVQLAGTLDILINNASVFSADTLDNMSFADLNRHIEVNAWAPFVLSREFARLGSGSIVNILDSRIAGFDWAHVSYLLSKQLFAAITRLSAAKFAPQVTVNGVAPGLILPPAGRDESYLDSLAHTVPLQRHGGPEDVAAAVLYLLRNDFLTGQIIFVDGGRQRMEG